jgi:hypothetical protein
VATTRLANIEIWGTVFEGRPAPLRSRDRDVTQP